MDKSLVTMNRHIIFFSFLVLFSSVLFAEEAYVSDQLETSLRRGEGLGFKIRRMLKSGEPLEVLKVNKDSGYTKVRTSGGTEGYVLSRHLMESPSARVRIEKIKSSNTELRLEITRLKSEIAQLDDVGKQQSSQINSSQSENKKLGEELKNLREATADVIAIKSKNDQLLKQVKALSSEKDILMRENYAYKDNTKQDWFIRGAAVVLLGVLVGLILPKLRRRRRWGEL